MVKAVNGMDARRLRQAARRMLDAVAVEVAREEADRLRRMADQHEATLLAEEEARAEVETWLTLGDNGNGTWSGRFTIPELHGQILRAARWSTSRPRGSSPATGPATPSTTTPSRGSRTAGCPGPSAWGSGSPS